MGSMWCDTSVRSTPGFSFWGPTPRRRRVRRWIAYGPNCAKITSLPSGSFAASRSLLKLGTSYADVIMRYGGGADSLKRLVDAWWRHRRHYVTAGCEYED